jgi:hypothetical protein
MNKNEKCSKGSTVPYPSQTNRISFSIYTKLFLNLIRTTNYFVMGKNTNFDCSIFSEKHPYCHTPPFFLHQAYRFQTTCSDSGFEIFTVVTDCALTRKLHELHFANTVVRLLRKLKLSEPTPYRS